MTSKRQQRQTVEEIAALVTSELFSSDDFKSVIEKHVSSAIEKKIGSLKDIIDKLEGRCFDAEQRLDKVEKENMELHKRIKSLESRHEKSEATINNMEQYSRRNNIRISGIRENQGENLKEEIKKLAREKLQFDLEDDHIDRCHRVGKSSADNKRPILIKLTSYQHKQKFMQTRRRLKSTGIVIREDLTQSNVQLLNDTRKKEKVANCWTFDGRIIALIKTSPDQPEKKQTIHSAADLDKL